jgi:MFS family permease
MVILDGTITIVALPSIGADLRFSEQGLQWVLSAYALTFVLAVIGMALALLLLGRPRKAAHELPDPVPALRCQGLRRREPMPRTSDAGT